nr:hypothetical protein [Tanacetum cinerariifolium]
QLILAVGVIAFAAWGLRLLLRAYSILFLQNNAMSSQLRNQRRNRQHKLHIQ